MKAATGRIAAGQVWFTPAEDVWLVVDQTAVGGAIGLHCATTGGSVTTEEFVGRYPEAFLVEGPGESDCTEPTLADVVGWLAQIRHDKAEAIDACDYELSAVWRDAEKRMMRLKVYVEHT